MPMAGDILNLSAAIDRLARVFQAGPRVPTPISPTSLSSAASAAIAPSFSVTLFTLLKQILTATSVKSVNPMVAPAKPAGPVVTSPVGSPVASAAGLGITAVIPQIAAIGGIISMISGLFNAPSAAMFARTLADIQGVIGNALVPVFRVFNMVARMVGDTLATVAPYVTGLLSRLEGAFYDLTPILTKVQSIIIGVGIAIAQYVGVLFDAYNALAQFLGLSSGMDMLSDALDYVAKALIGTAVAAQVLVENLKRLFTGEKMDSLSSAWDKIVAKTNSIWKEAQGVRRSSVGQGAANASYTDLESYEKKVRESAYQSSGMSAMEIQKRTADNTQTIAENTGKLVLSAGVSKFDTAKIPEPVQSPNPPVRD